MNFADHKTTKNLNEDKLHLRPYTMSDADTIYENLGCDPEMIRYTGWNPYFSPEATRKFVADVIQKYDSGEKEYSWLITYKGEPVGTIGAYDYDAEQNCIEIGYSIFREYWGKGFASRALKLVKDYLVQEEGIHTLKAWSVDANIASKRVLEKAGFKYPLSKNRDGSYKVKSVEILRVCMFHIMEKNVSPAACSRPVMAAAGAENALDSNRKGDKICRNCRKLKQ